MRSNATALACLVLLTGTVFAGCSKKSPTSPSPSPSSTPSRVIAVSGDLSFGDVEVNATKSKAIRVTNSGNAALTISGITGPHASIFSVTPLTATLPPSGSQDFTFFCKPAAVAYYAGVVSLTSDATSGNGQVNISCSGVRTGPPWRQDGTGDSVFDMPAFVAKVKVIGTYNGCSSNFIVRVSGRLLVNELVGTCWSQTRYEGTLLSGGGGQVTVTNSSGVVWSFEEVR